jgi:hypothetical protein
LNRKRCSERATAGGSEFREGDFERAVDVRSAMRPKMNVTVDRERPIMVRNWRCQPKDKF